MPDDLHARIAALAEIDSDHQGRGITREVYTPEYDRSVEYVSGLMRDAGLEVRLDAAGNLFGRWDGTEPDADRVLTGSHFDTTLDAGAYDGVLGVLGAIEAVRTLREEGFVPRRTLEVIGFAGEEPRFGAGCTGSRAMLGILDLDALIDRNGVSFADALAGAGFDPDRIGEARLDTGSVHAFVELHIEQGAVLESEGVSIGVVEHIAAPHDLRIVWRGRAMHAGATPMDLRKDALVGAAEAVVALEGLARDSPSPTVVGTVGVLEVSPGATNVIPGEVRMDVDIRDSDLDARTAVVDAFTAAVEAIAERRGLAVEIATVNSDVPAACDPVVVEAVRAACEETGFSSRAMISGAFHDAMILGREVPMGMIFVPSRDGLSHHPDEYTAPEELDRGVAVLTRTLARLLT